MRKYAVLFFFVTLLTSSTFGKNIDSLKLLLRSAPDSIKGSLYLKLIKYTSSDSIQLLTSYTESAIEHAKESLNDSLFAIFLNDLGFQFYSKSIFFLAEKFFLQSSQVEEKLGNRISTAKMYSNLAVVKEITGEYPKAIELYLSALKIFEEVNYEKGKSLVYSNLGVLYQEMKRKDECLLYDFKALELKIKLKDSAGIASSYNNIGVAFEELMLNHDSAIYYYEKALEYYKRLNNKLNYAITNKNIAGILHTMGKMNEAISRYHESIQIFTEETHYQGLAWCYRDLGNIYFELKNFDKSIGFLNRSLEISVKINDRKTQLDVLKVFSDVFYFYADYKKAADYLSKYIQLNDSLISSENQKQINDLTKKYELDLMQSKIEILYKDNEIKNGNLMRTRILVIALILVLFLVIILVFLVRKHAASKLKTHKIVSEQKLLRLQMNPHFISNALTAIQNFIYDNQPEKAANLLSGFSRLMRQTIKNTRQEYITIEEEIQSLKDYIELNLLRFHNRFEYQIDCDLKIVPEITILPPMLVQPFVENAIKHGFEKINYMGSLIIKFLISDNNLVISIIDNGVGLSKSINENNSHISYSMDITKERLHYFQKSDNLIHQIQVLDRIDTNGTIVSITIPLKLDK